MTFIWLWAFSLKTPLSILCAVALAGCFLSFFSARSSGRGDANLFSTLTFAIPIALIWGLIYSMPAPDYNVRTIVKQVPVAGRVETRVITQRYTLDSRFNLCLDQKSTPYSKDELNECMAFAKEYMAPRVVTVTQVQRVPVYSGVQVKTVLYTRDARMRYCLEKVGTDLDTCTKWVFKMEAGPQVQVRTVHDSYQQIFDKCSATGTISENESSSIRNERTKICGELALRASHDY